MILSVFFVLPATVGAIWITVDSLVKLVSGRHTAMFYVYSLIGPLGLLALLRYFVPFYRRTFKILSADTKLVVDTTISAITESASGNGSGLLIHTTYKTIDSQHVVSVHKINYDELRVGMNIKIHYLEHCWPDILGITK